MNAHNGSAPARFLDHIDHGRIADALNLVAAAADAGTSATTLVTSHLAPAQQLVGERWHQGVYNVSQEHRASAVVEDALGLLRHRIPQTAVAPRVALVCAADEWHTTPARMASLALSEAGWNVDFLGASTPADHLLEALTDTTPQVLAISATLPLSLRGVPPLVDIARSLDVPVLGGGAAFGTTMHRARMLGLNASAPDVTTANGVLSTWLDDPPVAATPAAPEHVLVERQWVARQRGNLVTRAMGRLQNRLPSMADYSEAQLEHTRRDLDYTLQYLETALLVDDPSLFYDYIVWLAALLAHRGLPPHVLATSIDVLTKVLDGDLPRSRQMMDAAAARIEGEPTTS